MTMTDLLTEYQKELFEMRFLEVEMRPRKSSIKSVDDDKKSFGPAGVDGDEVWRKAARHEI